MFKLLLLLLQIIELAGYTHRVSQMINVFEDINEGHFVKTGKLKEISQAKNYGVMEVDSLNGSLGHGQVVDLHGLMKVQAKKTDGDIMLENISIITPGGDVVVPNLSLQVILFVVGLRGYERQCRYFLACVEGWGGGGKR